MAPKQGATMQCKSSKIDLEIGPYLTFPRSVHFDTLQTLQTQLQLQLRHYHHGASSFLAGDCGREDYCNLLIHVEFLWSSPHGLAHDGSIRRSAFGCGVHFQCGFWMLQAFSFKARHHGALGRRLFPLCYIPCAMWKTVQCKCTLHMQMCSFSLL